MSTEFLESTDEGIFFEFDAGPFVVDQDVTITNTSSNRAAAIRIEAISGANLTNFGSVEGDGEGISASVSQSTFLNQSGTISGSDIGLNLSGGIRNTIVNSTTSEISGDTAIRNFGSENVILNSGQINGGLNGVGIIEKGWDNYILNQGSIFGGTGILVSSEDVEIVNDQFISGRNYGINFDSDAIGGVIRNNGFLSGNDNFGSVALKGNDTAQKVINNGIINGKVLLEGGDDLFDGRNGQARQARGGEGNDTLLGGDNFGRLFGDAGNDSISGGAQEDVLSGGDGNDTIYGGDSYDQLFGMDDDDLMFGGDGNDYLTGGLGNDTMFGGTGRDTLFGRDGDDSLSGGQNNDTINGNEGEDSLFGDEGDDFLSGGAQNDILSGGDGIDTLHGDEGDDEMSGGLGNDSLRGGQGNDTINGNEGEDTLFGDEGDDSLSGGAQNDLLSGGDGKDTLYGDEGDDRLFGLNGNDLMFGGAGDDQMFGGLGSDSLRGGFGSDTMFGREGNDVLEGGAGNDTIYGNDGSDWLYGGSGDDILIGGAGQDFLDGGHGANVFDFNILGDSAVGVYEADFIQGFAIGRDKVNISDLNAVGTASLVDAFSGSGNAEIRIDIFDELADMYVGSHVLIDVDGDGEADTAFFAQFIFDLSIDDFVL